MLDYHCKAKRLQEQLGNQQNVQQWDISIEQPVDENTARKTHHSGKSSAAMSSGNQKKKNCIMCNPA